MTGPNDTLDDETYESLIEELGLDLDIDEPIGEFGDDQTTSSDTADFVSETAAEMAGMEPAPPSGEDNGVEISADLLAELQSVIGGDSSAGSFDEDATFAEDPLHASADLENSKEDNLASALMGDVAAEIEAVSADVNEDMVPALEDEVEPEVEVPSVFDGLDLSEEALSKSDENDVFIDAELELESEVDDWVSNESSAATEETPLAITDLDSILEDALSKDFEPPLDDGQFTDRLNETKIYDVAEETTETLDAVELVEEVELEQEPETNTVGDFVAFEEPAISGSSLDEAEEYTTELPSFEEEISPSDTFSLSDFADDTEVSADPVSSYSNTPSSPPHNALGLAASLDDDAYVSNTPESVVSEDDDIDFAMSQSEGGDRIIPRITIHAFTQTQMCQQMLNRSMQDRRMANVSAEIVEGGVEAAINFYQENDLPHMIVVESISKSGRLLAELDELAQMCDENVKVVVIGAANDIRLYRELMNRGVSEYIVPPLETVQLIRAISSQFADPEQPFVGKTLAVTGVKGGVGSSTIAHNLAWTLAERLDQGTTLVDLDLNFGTTGLDFNNESNQTIADALLAPERFDDAVMSRLITQTTENLSLFTAPANLDRTYNVEEETYSNVLNKVRETVPFVVLDLPHIWSDWFKGTVVSADEIIVVAQPDLASLRNGKNLIDFLKAARPNDNKPRLVINQVGVPKRPEIPVKDFAQAMDLEPDLVLPFDPQLFGTAANNGQMIADIAEDSKCSQGIDYLASLVSGREIKTERSSLLNKLFKR